MKKPETVALNTIYDNIKNGMIYGEYYEPSNPVLTEPLFWYVLSCSPCNKYIRWCHFGSGANKCTISELKWILANIFKMSAIDFMNKYVVRV